ncbi:MAG: sulfite exporter TauE/SafE family protein [Alphaproteobacteria bacterium]|jgi:uncharacterized protein|nr:sulfite exporter TauE/SafE family protein [Alphaproteobacteria bacterium]MBT4084571.1 sulfite exporter TauE/SafE family protein [Alphaproteobacteria bacterium]MBT4544618.1 sulfite exporter TauE/SafE family protein [Alphaproteobacteria bacterium]MBT7745737.1 sulfite exporter TauE/SafE family protein [Alphaproteobacteria bacterium]
MFDEFFLIALAVYFLAGTIKGTIGIGLPATSISLLGQVYDPRVAIALAIMPIFFTNIWQIYRTGNVRQTLKSFWPFALALAVVLWIFTGFSAQISTSSLIFVLGCVVVLFAFTSLFVKPPELPRRYDRLAQVVAGSLSGVLGGLTAIWSPPMVVYLVSRRIEKDDFVRASGVLLFIGSVPLLFGYWQNGLMTRDLAVMSMAMIVPTLLGFSVGEAIRRRMDATRFQKLILFIFLLMGLNLIRRSFM